jgi:hypothetical protein
MFAANNGGMGMPPQIPMGQATGPVVPSESYVFPFHLPVLLSFYIVFFTWKLVFTLAFLFRIDRYGGLHQAMMNQLGDNARTAQNNLAASRTNPSYYRGTNQNDRNRLASQWLQEEDNRNNYRGAFGYD